MSEGINTSLFPALDLLRRGIMMAVVLTSACTDRVPTDTGLVISDRSVVAHAKAATLIHVDDNAVPGGDGSGARPLDNLSDAIVAARDISGPVVIKVEPGDYPQPSTLIIDRPLEIRGSTEMVEGPDGWPTGEVVAGTETRVFATNPATQRLIGVGRADATVLHNVDIRGMVFEATAAGTSVQLVRVQGYSIADNVFRAPALFALYSIASSGRAWSNYFTGVGTGAVLHGGYDESPSNVDFRGNRATANTLGGILLIGPSIDIPERGDRLNVTVRDNDLSGNNSGMQGFGLRTFIVRRDDAAPSNVQSWGHVSGVVKGNRIVGNRVGVSLDAGFPYRRVGTACDDRVFSGTIDLQFVGNTISQNALTPALITFTRNTAALDLLQLPQWQYLHGATFRITDLDGSLANARIDHPPTDPYIGTCPADAMHEPLRNTLILNGQVRAPR